MAKNLSLLGLALNRTHADREEARRPPLWLAPNLNGTGQAEVLLLAANRSGRIIGEIRGDLAGVAWKLNNYGQARMVLARAEATTQEALLRPGNRLLIQFGNGLPNWGGVIDLPRRWRPGQIEVTAYSAEYMLNWRITSRSRYFRNSAAGEIFKELVREAKPMGLSLGTIWLGGETFSPEYHYRSLLDVVQRSLLERLVDADWEVRADITGGMIRFSANFYERRGKYHGGKLALVEGVNLAETSLQEQGPVWNEISLVGSGTSWESDGRHSVVISDPASQAKYELRQKGDLQVDTTSVDTLVSEGDLMLNQYREPRSMVGVSALDRSPARFQEYGIGDYIYTELYSMGFDGYGVMARVVAREFLPRENICSLVLE